jgi:anti-sigma regulatory factor (Ser/Thr protein kinase)
VFGHEQGSKAEVLLQLRQDQGQPLWFIEDRRPTLETVRRTPGLETVRCFLVSWGYLGPGDREGLPDDIHLLTPEQFDAPLADWP